MTDLPDFHIPHAEKIEWMIEEHGWAIEPVAAQPDLDPPSPATSTRSGFRNAFDFPEVVLFGLHTRRRSRSVRSARRPVARRHRDPARSRVDRVCSTTICVACSPRSTSPSGAPLFATAVAWYRGAPFEVVQLLWPDRNGFLPTEPGFDRRLVLAQPVIGTLAE